MLVASPYVTDESRYEHNVKEEDDAVAEEMNSGNFGLALCEANLLIC
jgi:hypothetical protein